MNAILEGYITQDELAQQFSVTTRTIARWQAKPDGLPKTTIGGKTLYRVASVRAWLEAKEKTPNPRRK